jgi:hypothetical protein
MVVIMRWVVYVACFYRLEIVVVAVAPLTIVARFFFHGFKVMFTN